MVFSVGSKCCYNIGNESGEGVVYHLDLQSPKCFKEGFVVGDFLDGCGEEVVDFEVVVVDEQNLMVDVRSKVASRPCLEHRDCEVVCEVLLLEVDFKGACGGQRDFSLGGGDEVLSFRFSSLDVSRLTCIRDHMRILAVFLLKCVEEVLDELVIVVV
ncbi:hypothetical protein Tco_0138924 [Tanacetum coccineum]